MNSEWADNGECDYEFEPIFPAEVEVTEPELSVLLGPDGEPLLTVSDRPPFGFRAPS